MALTVGSRLGHYDVTALIGEGGMGQVYQATDTKLNRQVALKILPEAFAGDPDRLARFQREAQVLASLNHPGIAAIYGIEEADDTRALVLELVEGPTLADRIKRGPIPVDEALPIAKQIAEALEAAHEQGVIHRDLKPANIKVRDDGTVKVLDFGLAKALDTSPQGDPSQSPTLTAAATQMGVIMGTAAYMSPEQAAGKPVDKRSDIWSFGVVLFEMLTGDRLFTGETVSHVWAAVLRAEPDWHTLPDSVPTPVRRFLRRCLERDTKQRLRDIGEARVAIDEVLSMSSETDQDEVGVPQRRLGVLFAALVVAVGVAVWGWLRTGEAPVSPAGITSRTQIGNVGHIMFGRSATLSPDGESVVFVGPGIDAPLFRRRLDDLEPTPIQGTDGAHTPFFSPDGQWVGFARGWGIEKVRLFGGSVTPVVEADVAVCCAPSWTADGWVYFRNMVDNSLSRVRDDGGEVFRIERSDLEGTVLNWPSPLPGAGLLLVTDVGLIPHLGIVEIDTGAVRIDESQEIFAPRFVPPATLVFARLDGTLLAAPFDSETGAVTGVPTTIATDVEVVNNTPQFSVSPAGSIIYVADEGDELVWERLDEHVRLATDERLNFTNQAALSPDGSQFVVSLREGASRDARVYDINGRGQTATLEGLVSRVIWARDGLRITSGLYDRGVGLSPASGGVEAEMLVEGPRQWVPTSWSANGERLALIDSQDYNHPFLLDPETGTLEEFSPGSRGVTAADYSPDGGVVAFQSMHADRDRSHQIYVQAVNDGVPVGQRVRVSYEGGISPRWSRDSETLYYIKWRTDRPRRAYLVAVDIAHTPELQIGTETELADWSVQGVDSAYRFDIHPNGEILRTRSTSTRSLVLLLNWQTAD